MNERLCVAFRSYDYVGLLKSILLSRLNTWPARAPVNASPEQLPVQTHDSGSARVATPCTGISKSRQWAFQSFRKTHLTTLAGLSLEHEQGLAVAQQSAGHSNRAVTTGHYISGDVQERMVAVAIKRMPSPVAARRARI